MNKRLLKYSQILLFVKKIVVEKQTIIAEKCILTRQSLQSEPRDKNLLEELMISKQKRREIRFLLFLYSQLLVFNLYTWTHCSSDNYFLYKLSFNSSWLIFFNSFHQRFNIFDKFCIIK